MNTKVMWNWIRRLIFGYCHHCGSIGTMKEKTDTGLLLEFNDIWLECTKCGYRQEYSGD